MVVIRSRQAAPDRDRRAELDRKSTRLNSSHQIISYAVFCLKKKKNINKTKTHRLRKEPTIYEYSALRGKSTSHAGYTVYVDSAVSDRHTTLHMLMSEPRTDS